MEVSPMSRLLSPLSLLFAVAVAVVALAVAGQGRARSAESVTCSTATPAGSINLTGKWTASDGQPYYLRQIGSCLWWAGSRARSNVFFGTVFGSTVTGVWVDVLRRSSGTGGSLTLLISPTKTALYRRSSTGVFPARILRKSG
jgi:hypothetical protein